MQSEKPCLADRKCWNLIVTPSLSWEINEETKNEKKKKKSVRATSHKDIKQMRASTHFAKNAQNSDGGGSIYPPVESVTP